MPMIQGLIVFSFMVLIPVMVDARVFYIDPVSGSDSLNNGRSTTAAWKSFRNIFSYRSDKRPSYWVQLSAGDTIFVMDGTISTVCRPGDDHGAANVSGRPAIMQLSGITGTLLSPVKLMAYSGAAPILDPGYSGEGIYMYQCQYIEISGITIKSAMAENEGGGLAIENSRNIKIHDVTIYNTDGPDVANMAGLHCLGGTDVEIYNCVFHDNYDRTGSGAGGVSSQNAFNLVFFQGGNISIHDCLVYQTPPSTGASNSGGGIKYKAASEDSLAYFRVYNNIFRNCKFYSVASGTANTHIHHNIVIGGNVAFSVANQANITRLMNDTVEYNTMYNTHYAEDVSRAEAAFDYNPGESMFGEPYVLAGSLKNITFRNNIVYDKGLYGAEHTPVYMYGYVDDAHYNAGIPELHSDYNAYYNSSGNTLEFSVAYGTGQGALGGRYNLTQWRALSWVNPANGLSRPLNFDLNSVNVNPQFIAIDTNLSDYGPLSNAFRPISGSPAQNMGAYAPVTSTIAKNGYRVAGQNGLQILSSLVLAGRNLVIRVYNRSVESVNIFIFTTSGKLVSTTTNARRIPGGITTRGQGYSDYTCSGPATRGVYYLVLSGMSSTGKTINARTMLTVIR